MGLCFRRFFIQYISETKPDGITLSGFFISNFKKGKPKMKKVKITNYYTQTEILERASANMVLLESQKEFREKLAALLSIHLGKVTDKISDIAVERNVGARTVNAVLSEQLSSAYCFLDDNEQYNKVILDTNENNEFSVRYCMGKHTEPVKAPTQDNFDFEISLLNELSCESNINKFCCELCESAQFKNQTEKQLYYSFLQTVCRYLSYNIRPSERRMDSIFKFAGATDKPYPDAVAPFEIICNDFIKDGRNANEDEKSFFEFHFKQYSKNYLPDTRNILEKALEISSKAYFKKLSENQNKT